MSTWHYASSTYATCIMPIFSYDFSINEAYSPSSHWPTLTPVILRSYLVFRVCLDLVVSVKCFLRLTPLNGNLKCAMQVKVFLFGRDVHMGITQVVLMQLA